jgi:predicted RNase H-like nuclease (RuvC/YqgF family)
MLISYFQANRAMRSIYHYSLPPNLDKLGRVRLESTKKKFQRLIDDFEQEASALDYGIMKYIEEMDHLENKIILTSYPPMKQEFKTRLEIVKAKKESDYTKSRELKSEIATLNYYLEELDLVLNRLIDAVDLSE